MGIGQPPSQSRHLVRIFSPTKQVDFWMFIQSLVQTSFTFLKIKKKKKSLHAYQSLCSQSAKPRQLTIHWSRSAVARCLSQSLSNPLPKPRTSAEAKSSSHQFRILFAVFAFPIVSPQGPDSNLRERRMRALQMYF